eukprot:TRINITY_DN13026_c0_g1_i1.p1 TRINITY_DN13026_c0_g1~~TRINITY_DN13026_c0_g1_i1.p1  ORF type:complete len:378 (+),score=39.11 TRINITY_DN13026_c0_g1_i1:29-1135(+)
MTWRFFRGCCCEKNPKPQQFMLRRLGWCNRFISHSVRLLRRRYSNTTTKHKGLWAHLPKRVAIYEVGPRDGLQNEDALVPTETKIKLINQLADTGLDIIESGSFVSARAIPQMADTSAVMKGINRKPNVTYPVLTPNLRGHEDALKSGADSIAVFAAASEGFSRHNINSSIDDSLKMYRIVTEKALKSGIEVRGYVSCVCGCPYDGYVDPKNVAYVAKELLDMGCYEVSLGDTIGIGTPGKTFKMLETVLQEIPKERLAVHFHNTYGQALANVLVSLQMGISVIDSSVAGLGGCPYAKGATGNVSTEDVVYMCHGLGIKTGVDLDKLIEVGNWISKKLNKRSHSKVGVAVTSKKDCQDELLKDSSIIW